MGASAKIVLFKSKKFSDETHPVLLRVTINRKLKYYNVGSNYKCNEKQWEGNEFNKKFPDHEKANRELYKVLVKANDVIIDLKENVPHFNLTDFDRKFIIRKERIFLFEYFDTSIFYIYL